MALHTREEEVGGRREVRFSLRVDGELVPGVLILPPGREGPLPLVLIQHPATSSKDDYFVRDVALRWSGNGWACGGIDAPFHGERETYDPMRILQDRDAFPAVAARFAKELSATVDALAETYPLDLGQLAYVGYSLGSMLGLPALAADGRFSTAVLCLIGEGGLAGSVKDDNAPARQLTDVAVRIVGKLSDEFFSRASTEALFDTLPGEKDLLWLPGGHFEIGPDVIQAAEQWLRRHLR